MKLKMPKIDWSIIVEFIGLGLASYGLFLIAPPVAFVALGSFLIWTTERK